MSIYFTPLSKIALFAVALCPVAQAASFSNLDDALKCPDQSATYLTCTLTVAIDMGPSPWTYKPVSNQTPSVRLCRNNGNASDVADFLMTATATNDGTFARSTAPLVGDQRSQHEGIKYSETAIPLNTAGTYVEYQLDLTTGSGYNLQIDTMPMINDGSGGAIGVGDLNGYSCK